MAGKLNPRQALFYGEYIKDGNATRAAIAAGFPESSAAVAGARLLRNAKVAAAIDAWRDRKKAEFELTADEVLRELKSLATFDPGNLYDRNGNRIPVHLLDDVTRAAVAAVEDETLETGTGKAKKVTRSQKVKMADKGQNLERLGRYFKLFTDKVEHHGKVTLEQLVSGENSGDATGQDGEPEDRCVA